MQTWSEKLQLWAIRILPKHLLTKILGRLAEVRFPQPILRLVIARFVKHYQIDMSEAATTAFATFNDFFTRPLVPEVRPIADGPAVVVSPVDGVVGMWGNVENDTLLQAKGVDYSLAGLVGKAIYADWFRQGSYCTLYLSPRHYHRIHAPLTATIEEMYYLPGTLYPVNRLGVEYVPGLFARNERLITILSHPQAGKLAVIKIGATVVGKIKVVYDTIVAHPSSPVHKTYPGIPIAKGSELGRFELGSTVILLAQSNKVAWHGLSTAAPVKMGQMIGKVL